MNVRLPYVLTVALVSSFVVAACGGGAPTPETPPPPASAAPTASAPPAATTPTPPPETTAATTATPPPPPPEAVTPKTWKDATTKDAQVAFMKANVAPSMAKIFQAQDAKQYADFGCKSCHGPKHVAPKDFLPKLTMKGGKLTSMKDKPAITKFMIEKVAPEMAKILGEQPFDPKTKTGFGCGGCHVVEMKLGRVR